MKYYTSICVKYDGSQILITPTNIMPDVEYLTGLCVSDQTISHILVIQSSVDAQGNIVDQVMLFKRPMIISKLTINGSSPNE